MKKLIPILFILLLFELKLFAQNNRLQSTGNIQTDSLQIANLLLNRTSNNLLLDNGNPLNIGGNKLFQTSNDATSGNPILKGEYSSPFSLIRFGGTITSASISQAILVATGNSVNNVKFGGLGISGGNATAFTGLVAGGVYRVILTAKIGQSNLSAKVPFYICFSTLNTVQGFYTPTNGTYLTGALLSLTLDRSSLSSNYPSAYPTIHDYESGTVSYDFTATGPTQNFYLVASLQAGAASGVTSNYTGSLLIRRIK